MTEKEKKLSKEKADRISLEVTALQYESFKAFLQDFFLDKGLTEVQTKRAVTDFLKTHGMIVDAY